MGRDEAHDGGLVLVPERRDRQLSVCHERQVSFKPGVELRHEGARLRPEEPDPEGTPADQQHCRQRGEVAVIAAVQR